MHSLFGLFLQTKNFSMGFLKENLKNFPKNKVSMQKFNQIVELLVEGNQT